MNQEQSRYVAAVNALEDVIELQRRLHAALRCMASPWTWSQPATETEPLTSSSALTNGAMQ